MTYFFKNVTFFTPLGPISTRLYIITVINNCQSAASVQHSGRLISMAQHLFCGEADYFLQQARAITLVKWYHINQNLTRWQIWSYQIPRDTVTNMSLSQELSAGKTAPHRIYHPTGSQGLLFFSSRILPYSEMWEHEWYENVNGEVQAGCLFGSAEGEEDRKRLIPL